MERYSRKRKGNKGARNPRLSPFCCFKWGWKSEENEKENHCRNKKKVI